MRVDLAYAERQLRHWTKKVEELRLTSNASNTKEGEKGKETLPPTPPIREKGKGEENIITRARTCEVGELSKRLTDEILAVQNGGVK